MSTSLRCVALAAIACGALGCDLLLGIEGTYEGPPATSSSGTGSAAATSGAGGQGGGESVPCEPPAALAEAATGCPEGMVSPHPTFCIQAREVTFGAYVAFVESVRASGATCFATSSREFCRDDDPYNGLAEAFLAADPDLPAHPLDYCDARAYCNGQGMRLCTKEEWFLACRAPARPGVDPPEYEATFPWHADESGYACVDTTLDGDPTNDVTETDPATSTCHGSAPPRDAIFDIVGNVAEFAEECFADNCIARGAQRGVEDVGIWEGAESCDKYTGAPLKDDIVLKFWESAERVAIPPTLRTGARCCW